MKMSESHLSLIPDEKGWLNEGKEAACASTAQTSASTSRECSEEESLEDCRLGELSDSINSELCSMAAGTPRTDSSNAGDAKLKRIAFFCLSAACMLPWDCLVLDMGAFHTRYVPTYPWIEISTEVRTLCSVVGHLLVFMLSPGLSNRSMTLGGCFAAAAACCCLAVIAPLAAAPKPGGLPPSIAAERFVFNACCVLVGVLGLCCSAMHAGVFGLHAVICPSLAVSWTLGRAFASPFGAAVALLLYGCLGTDSPALSTRLLLGVCSFWLIASGCLLSAALRSPAARKALLLQRQQSLQCESHDEQVAQLWGVPSQAPAQHWQWHQPGILMEAGDEANPITGTTSDQDAHESEALLLNPLSSQTMLSRKVSVRRQWHLYAEVLLQCRCSLLCCFFLSLTTFALYPIKVQHMRPCSSMDPAFYQLLLVASYHLGVVAGRCIWCWCCALSFRLVPAVLVLRLTLLPLLYWFESLPGAALLHHMTAAVLALRPQPVMLLLDLCRFLALFLFSALHGHLSVVGAVHATGVPEKLPAKEAAAFLMSLSEALGVAAGVVLSTALPSSNSPLDGWKETAVATAHKLA